MIKVQDILDLGFAYQFHTHENSEHFHTFIKIGHTNITNTPGNALRYEWTIIGSFINAVEEDDNLGWFNISSSVTMMNGSFTRGWHNYEGNIKNVEDLHTLCRILMIPIDKKIVNQTENQ